MQTHCKQYNQHKQPDFTGQDIFAGIDVHKKSFTVSIYVYGYEYKTFTQTPDTVKLVNYLRKHFPKANYKSVYEAGFSGYWIHDELVSMGVDNIIVNAADVPLTDKDKKNKTDSIDSRRLAKSLMGGLLTPIYIPEDYQRQDRSLVRTRYSFVQKQTRVKNQIKSFLSFHGIQISEQEVQQYWSKNYIKKLEAMILTQDSRSVSLRMYLTELSHLKQIILDITREIRRLSRSDRYRKNVELLITVPGVSVLTAMILLTEIADIRRFKKFDKLNSYVGLIPSEHSSGEKDLKGDITSRRNRFLRHVLIESSWVAIRKDSALMLSNKLYRSRGKNGPEAIVKIARKLVSRIHQVLVNQQPYCLAISA